jgi:hypothetical protein
MPIATRPKTDTKSSRTVSASTGSSSSSSWSSPKKDGPSSLRDVSSQYRVTSNHKIKVNSKGFQSVDLKSGETQKSATLEKSSWLLLPGKAKSVGDVTRKRTENNVISSSSSSLQSLKRASSSSRRQVTQTETMTTTTNAADKAKERRRGREELLRPSSSSSSLPSGKAAAAAQSLSALGKISRAVAKRESPTAAASTNALRGRGGRISSGGGSLQSVERTQTARPRQQRSSRNGGEKEKEDKFGIYSAKSLGKGQVAKQQGQVAVNAAATAYAKNNNRKTSLSAPEKASRSSTSFAQRVAEREKVKKDWHVEEEIEKSQQRVEEEEAAAAAAKGLSGGRSRLRRVLEAEKRSASAYNFVGGLNRRRPLFSTGTQATATGKGKRLEMAALSSFQSPWEAEVEGKDELAAEIEKEVIPDNHPLPPPANARNIKRPAPRPPPSLQPPPPDPSYSSSTCSSSLRVQVTQEEVSFPTAAIATVEEVKEVTTEDKKVVEEEKENENMSQVFSKAVGECREAIRGLDDAEQEQREYLSGRKLGRIKLQCRRMSAS